MGSKFRRLTKQEQSAVAAYAKREFDKVIALQPGTYVSMNAQSDPQGWQERLSELIAGDEKRVAAIVEAYARAAGIGQGGFTPPLQAGD